MWAYAYMKGWKQNEHIDFDFHDAHDLRPLVTSTNEETIKARLRERMRNSKQVIVLVGPNTRNLYRFVRWEIELAMSMDLPIVVVNLNNARRYDAERCPPILRDHYAIHVAHKAKIIKFALDNFPQSYSKRNPTDTGWRYYPDDVYQKLNL